MPRPETNWELMVLAFAAILLTAAAGIAFLVSANDDPAAIPVTAAAGGDDVVYDFAATGSGFRLTEDTGIAAGAAAIVANEVAAAGGVAFDVDFVVDGGPEGVRVQLATSLPDAEPIDRYVVGRQRIALDEPGWQLRCVEVAPCTYDLLYRFEIPTTADFVDVEFEVGGVVVAATGDVPEGASADITIAEPLLDDLPYSANTVGFGVGGLLPAFGVARVTTPAGFDDPEFAVLVFARAPDVEVTVSGVETVGRQTSSNGIQTIVPPFTSCPIEGPDCEFDVWVLATAGDEGAVWVETRGARRAPPLLQLHGPEPVVVSGGGADPVTLALSVPDGAANVAAVLVPEGFDDEELVVEPLCDPDCAVDVDLGTSSGPWTVTGYLISTTDVFPAGNRQLSIAVR